MAKGSPSLQKYYWCRKAGLCWWCARPVAVRLITQNGHVVEQKRATYCWPHLKQHRRLATRYASRHRDS